VVVDTAKIHIRRQNIHVSDGKMKAQRENQAAAAVQIARLDVMMTTIG
jgi:hypothetical protein